MHFTYNNNQWITGIEKSHSGIERSTWLRSDLEYWMATGSIQTFRVSDTICVICHSNSAMYHFNCNLFGFMWFGPILIFGIDPDGAICSLTEEQEDFLLHPEDCDDRTYERFAQTGETP